MTSEESDPINPEHYKSHPLKIECIEIAESAGFNLGNAIKYIWRTAWPGRVLSREKKVENLKKAIWYIGRQIESLLRD